MYGLNVKLFVFVRLTETEGGTRRPSESGTKTQPAQTNWRTGDGELVWLFDMRVDSSSGPCCDRKGSGMFAMEASLS